MMRMVLPSNLRGCGCVGGGVASSLSLAAPLLLLLLVVPLLLLRAAVGLARPGVLGAAGCSVPADHVSSSLLVLIMIFR